MLAPLISPNLHVILIHYPLAMLIAGTLIECFSFLWRRSGFRYAGRWMILIGAMSAIPATFSGIYALRDIARNSEVPWVELKMQSPVLSRPEIWHMLRIHTLYQSIATGAAALIVVCWLGSSDRLRRSFHFVFLLLMLGTVGLMVSGAWLGGESIYRKGVAVEPVFPVTTQPADEIAETSAGTSGAATQPVTWLNTPTKAEQLFPPLELHVIMAGVFTAIALLSVGLSFRKFTSVSHHTEPQPMVTGDPATVMTGGTRSPRTPPRTPPSPADMVRTFNPDFEIEVHPFVPASRFWMLAFLLAVFTFTGGLFIIARGADLLPQMHDHPNTMGRLLWNQIYPRTGPKVTRSVVHAAAGSALIVLPIVLALLSRFAPRERILLMLITLLLSAVIAVQVWMGVLLLFDTSDGPVNHFNPPMATEIRH